MNKTKENEIINKETIKQKYKKKHAPREEERWAWAVSYFRDGDADAINM